MHNLKITALAPALALALMLPSGLATAAEGVAWQEYTPQAFEQADEQEKLILIDLVAVWCHWCHVMEETTYTDARVREQIAEHYVPIKADHDARPDLAERYRDYGWPATIIVTPDGRELVKRAGYIEPARMAELLAQTRRRGAYSGVMANDYRTGEATRLDRDQRAQLRQRHLDSHDRKLGGLRLMQKFLDPDSVLYDLQLARAGDLAAEARARVTLQAAARLVDPEFGGAYQYSTHGDWQHPHYEKIATTQAAYLRVYSRAYRQLGDPAYRRVAKQVADYVIEFWQSGQGGFYNSQDADLQQGRKAHDYFALPRERRLELGLPRIDRNRYASTNGLLIEGLAELYLVTEEPRYLTAAVKAFDWTLRNRRRSDGGFDHGDDDSAGPFLADNLYMGRALLAVYRASGQDRWLEQAGRLADYIGRNFADPRGGLLSAVDNGTPIKPLPQIDQNIQAAEFLLQLATLSDTQPLQALIGSVMRYLVSDSVATSRLSDPGILILDDRWRLLQQTAGLDTDLQQEKSNVRL